MSRSGRRSAPTPSRSRTTGRKPVDHATAPAVQLADAIAATIAQLARQRRDDRGQRASALDAGDVLVLVRKRDRFVHALSRSLKNRDIPVAGADRLSLPGAYRGQGPDGARPLPAAAGRRSVAGGLLKSPIFGLTEEDAFRARAWRASGSLADRVAAPQAAERPGPRRSRGAARRHWANEAGFKPVFEFYAGVLGRDGVRQQDDRAARARRPATCSTSS